MSRAACYGCMAGFRDAHALLTAVRRLRGRGHVRLEAYAPHAVDGLAEALGVPPSRLPWAMLAGGMVAGGSTLALQYYSAVINYPVHIAGRPLASWPAFIPAALEMTLLGAAVAGVLAFFLGSHLPQLYHPAFNAAAFARASQDRFVLIVRSDDPRYHDVDLMAVLEDIRPSFVVEVWP